MLVFEESIDQFGLAGAIKMIRSRCRMTQAQFSKHVGIGVATLVRYESGSTIPKPFVLRKLIEVATDLQDASSQRILQNAMEPSSARLANRMNEQILTSQFGFLELLRYLVLTSELKENLAWLQDWLSDEPLPNDSNGEVAVNIHDSLDKTRELQGWLHSLVNKGPDLTPIQRKTTG